MAGMGGSIGIPQGTVGPYRIEREIARGGMGIVYLARDTRLDRAVAIKALPDDVASDPDRLARFEREAKVLASLNHPNIAGIYGVEEAEGRRYLALEHIEGETLAARLARGPMPLAEALEICLEIAAGVEAAHENAVIHRDLKPGNVMITPGDRVKVLDFGLAKGKVAAESDHGALANSPTLTESPVLPHSPTIHSPATIPGVILGTAAYLSPEQARGKAVDRRTDIWSFGCVLYECLSGKRAFEGETVSDTIAKILERDLDWSKLPKSTPPRIRELLRRCLEKDPRKRLRDIGEARLVLEEQRAGGSAAGAAEPPPAPRPPSRLQRMFEGRGGILFGIGLALGAALGIKLWGSAGDVTSMRRGDRAVTRLSIVVPPGLRAQDADITPDGRTVLLQAQPQASSAGQESRSRLYVRTMDRLAFEAIPGTEGVLGFTVAPDGRWIVFAAPVSERIAQQRLLKVPVDGSAPPTPISKWEDDWVGSVACMASGDIYVATNLGKEFVRIPLGGGPPSKSRRFETPDTSTSFTFRSGLPGNHGALLTAISYQGGAFHSGIGVVDLRSAKTKILFRDGGSPHYAPGGHLLFTKNDVLLTAPFDLGKLEVTGEPVAVLNGLRTGSSWGNAGFDLSNNGVLQTASGGSAWANRRAVIVDHKGAVSEWSPDREAFETWLSVSRQGNRFASVIANANAIYEIWVLERGRRSARRVVAVPGADVSSALWSPDGGRIAYTQANRSDSDGVYVVNAEGTGVPRKVIRWGPQQFGVATSWSPDGAQILCTLVRSNRGILSVAPAEPGGAASEPRPVFSGAAQTGGGSFSPDGQSIAYHSDESGSYEAYVCRWAQGGPTGEPLLVSSGGGTFPGWSPDGRHLYYLSPQNKLMMVAISARPRLEASSPSVAWDLDGLRLLALYDILPDDRLLAIQKAEGEDEITQFDLTLNFFEDLKRRLAAAKRN